MKLTIKEPTQGEYEWRSDFTGKPAACRLELTGSYGSEICDLEKYVFDLSDDDARRILAFIQKELPYGKNVDQFAEKAGL